MNYHTFGAGLEKKALEFRNEGTLDEILPDELILQDHF